MVSTQQLEIVGLVAAVLAFWGQIKALLDIPRRWLIVRRNVDDDAAGVLLSYLQANARTRPRDGGYYKSDRVHVRPLGRAYTVFSEVLNSGSQLSWLRHRPIWYARYQPQAGLTMTFLYVRGTIRWEALLADVAAWADLQSSSKLSPRHRIVAHSGSMEDPAGLGIGRKKSRDTDGDTPTSAPTSGGGPIERLQRNDNGRRLIGWKPEEIGYAKPMPLDQMSLRPEMRSLALDVSHFLSSREWCEERGVPWRRGWLLHGPPGTGKTSFVRAMGIEHDLPVHVFDLSACTGAEFRWAWASMLEDAPCIALIEDIDAVYDGRELRANQRGPTFDVLLNAIGGVSVASGVLVFVTTNRPDCVDAALRRGGRLDSEIEFSRLDGEGRDKMVRRILAGYPADIAAALQEPVLADLSPADLQERLCRIALARRFGEVT